MVTKNINYVVSSVLDEDSVLRIGFERGLVSPGAVAKHIVAMHPGKELHPESVRTAVRRFRKELRKDSNMESVENILANSFLHVRSNMVKVEFSKEDSTLQLINKSFKINEIYNNDLFRLIKGHSVLHAIVEESNLDRILNVFEGKIKMMQKDLCEFIVIMPYKARNTSGLLMALSNELALNNINIVEAFSVGEEINLIVEEEDNQKTFNLLNSLFKRCRANSETEDKQ